MAGLKKRMSKKRMNMKRGVVPVTHKIHRKLKRDPRR